MRNKEWWSCNVKSQ